MLRLPTGAPFGTGVALWRVHILGMWGLIAAMPAGSAALSVALRRATTALRELSSA
ncbi:MAG: hypothetical protein HOW59_06720 [Nonomuraea sp.]|nr:hypothetical protein [Nonomuraea sp.]